MITITMNEARAAGYRALTNNYQLPEEQGMLEGVLADMRRGRIDHVLVKRRGGVSVWRKRRRVGNGTPHPGPLPSEGRGRFSFGRSYPGWRPGGLTLG